MESLLPTADLTSDRFDLYFDVYTPRPHLIFHDNEQGELHDLTESFLHSMVELSLGFVKFHQEKYAFKHPLLSIHRGTWISTTMQMANRLVAHICTDTDSYLKLFNDHTDLITGWPDAKFMTEQWKSTKDPQFYDLNVRGYPYKNYVSKEVKQIRKLSMRRRLYEGQRSHYRKYEVEFHPKAARIGFGCSENPPSNQDRLRLLMAMQEFARYRGMDAVEPDADKDLGGCHLCISLNDESCPGFSPNIFGYIQMCGWNFYRHCPASMREDWLKNFEAAKMPNMT